MRVFLSKQLLSASSLIFCHRRNKKVLKKISGVNLRLCVLILFYPRVGDVARQVLPLLALFTKVAYGVTLKEL